MLSFLFKILPAFFGSSNNGRGLSQGLGSGNGGIFGAVVSVIDKFFPSAETRQKNDESDKTANAESQNSARAMKFKSHDSWLDILVDAWNRSIRPMVTTGLVGIWFGWWDAPDLSMMHPFYVVMTQIVFTFWFGGRFVTKDIVPAIQKWQDRKIEQKRKLAEIAAIELSAFDGNDYEDEPVIKD
jgi:hypothetical protein